MLCLPLLVFINCPGAKNIYDDTGIEEKKTWVSGDWDTIIERDPDLIVLVDASWDWADEKIFHLCSNEKLRQLRAVQNRAFIVVPFSASTLGVRIGSLAFNLAEAMTGLIQGEALPSLEFSTENGRVLGKSGVRVMEKLPMWNGTDLDGYVPALPRQSNLETTSPSMKPLSSRLVSSRMNSMRRIKYSKILSRRRKLWKSRRRSLVK